MTSVLISAIAIFLLRVLGVTLSTLRIHMVVRNRKKLAWAFAFFQALCYMTAIMFVFTDLQDWPSLIGYAAGFATGNTLGIIIEKRLAIGDVQLRIVSSHRGAEVLDLLRSEGYAVTEISGRGRDGTVSVVLCNVKRKLAERVIELVYSVDDDAFVVTENIRRVQRGFWRR
jgi:uncharacterized protein YebE (UPF0316 family)